MSISTAPSAGRPPLLAGPAASATFEAIGTTNTVLATHPRVLEEAVAVAEAHLRELDLAVSRFRPDSEVSLLAARARRGPAEAFVSPIFSAYLSAALVAARLTGGLVDPTVGALLVANGYDADLAQVQARDSFTQVSVGRAPRWTSVHLNPSARRVSVAGGTLLDLGASAKAHAADTIARLLAGRLSGGFVVNLGGDIAVAGELPRGGWPIGVEDVDGVTREVLTSLGQGVATSSTQRRVWQTADGPRHHIVDPRPGHLAPAIWAQVTCVGASTLEANAASTAAVVLGRDAPEWLTAQGIPARLVRLDGHVATTPGWPEPMARVAP